MTTLTDTIAEGVGVHHTQVVAIPRTAADDIGVSAVPHDNRAFPITLSQGIGIAPVQLPYRVVVIAEALGLLETLRPAIKYHLTAADGIGAEGALTVALPVTLSQGVGMALAQQVRLAVTVLEELDLTSTFAPKLTYHLTLTQVLGLASALDRFIGGTIDESVGMASVLAGVKQMTPTLTEGIGIAPTQAHVLMLRVAVEEEIGIDPVQALRMLYSPVLAEGIQLSAAYVSPGSSITTWAMNTRTAAVTEYDNYDFNSFARLGNKYVGANQDGLYELLGDDDDGTDIIARIKSGFAQWAGTRFTLFKGIYLGIRGNGDFVFKLTTGDGKDYHYGVNVRDMRSTKVHMGKGLRTRYFAFELISTGQDFDLDTIEFVPLVAERRV